MIAWPVVRTLAREIGVEPEREPFVRALLALGVSPDAIRRAFEHGRIEDAISDPVLDPVRAERTVTLCEIEANEGSPSPRSRDVVRASGLPALEPDNPYF